MYVCPTLCGMLDPGEIVTAAIPVLFLSLNFQHCRWSTKDTPLLPHNVMSAGEFDQSQDSPLPLIHKLCYRQCNQ